MSRDRDHHNRPPHSRGNGQRAPSGPSLSGQERYQRALSKETRQIIISTPYTARLCEAVIHFDRTCSKLSELYARRIIDSQKYQRACQQMDSLITEFERQVNNVRNGSKNNQPKSVQHLRQPAQPQKQMPRPAQKPVSAPKAAAGQQQAAGKPPEKATASRYVPVTTPATAAHSPAAAKTGAPTVSAPGNGKAAAEAIKPATLEEATDALKKTVTAPETNAGAVAPASKKQGRFSRVVAAARSGSGTPSS